MPPGDLQRQLRRIFSLWDETEERIKEAERLRAEVVIPSIKELRYGGRWLADIIGIILPYVEDTLTDEQQSRIDHALFEAEQNCVRAKNDAIDAALLFIHNRLDQMTQEFGVHIVFSYFPEYADFRRSIRAVDVIITETRGTERPNRNARYDEIAKDHLPKMIDLYEKMSASEALIQGSLEEVNRQDRSKRKLETIKTVGGYVIGVIGIIVGVVLYYMAKH